jgi:hypothetical protein
MLVVGGLYVADDPVELLREPGPVRLHETPLDNLSLIMIAVMPTVRPWSIVVGEEEDKLTEIGRVPDEHPPIMTARFRTNNITQKERILNMNASCIAF